MVRIFRAGNMVLLALAAVALAGFARAQDVYAAVLGH